MEEENNINQLIENLSKDKLEQFKNEINICQNIFINQINEKFQKFDQAFNFQIEKYNQQIKNKLIDDMLRKKEINIEELKIPPLISLKKLDNTNYLINLILQYLSNVKLLVLYFLSQKNENKIHQNSNNNPAGIYLCPAFQKLLDNLWKGANNIYQPKEIHEILKKLMNNEYNSSNPGKFLEFIILKLHEELKSNKFFLEKPDGNFEEKKAYDQFDTYFHHYKTKASVEFFATIEIIKKPPNMPNFYSFETAPTIEINLDNAKRPNLSLEIDFKDLYKNYNEQINQGYIKKSIINIPNQLIININRGNNQKNFVYPLILEIKCILEKSDLVKNELSNLYDLYGVIMKNNQDYYAYLKNCINSKWYFYKDEVIQLVNDENDVINEKKAILLIYRKITQ